MRFDKQKIFVLTTTCALAVMLSGCQSGSPEANGLNGDHSDSAAKKRLSEIWQAKNPDAASIAEDLVAAGICAQIDRNETGSYANDMLTRFNSGNFVFCRNWPESVSNPAKLDCASEVFVTTGAKNLFDPKRELIYEDGLSVALYYGKSYQVEFSPLLGAMLSTKQIIKNCTSVIEKADLAIGGAVNHLGN